MGKQKQSGTIWYCRKILTLTKKKRFDGKVQANFVKKTKKLTRFLHFSFFFFVARFKKLIRKSF